METIRKNIQEIISYKLLEIMNDHLTIENTKIVEDGLDKLMDLLVEDLISYVDRDPASGGDYERVLNSSLSFNAVIYYRLSNLIWSFSTQGDLKESAFKIAELNKLNCGIDIHPGAKIGRRFVLDHAHSIVIGETVSIGSDCYMLGGVTLGATGISRNDNGVRHPQIGDHVQIGASVRIFGPAKIGNNVFIAPNCVVTSDIPDGTRISILNQVQVIKVESNRKLEVSGFFIVGEIAYIVFNGKPAKSVQVVNFEHQNIPAIRCSIINCEDSLCKIEFKFEASVFNYDEIKNLHLRVVADDSETIFINPMGLSSLLKKKYVGNNERYNREINEHRAAV